MRVRVNVKGYKVKKHASFMHDTSIEEKTATSDIASVRSHRLRPRPERM